MSTSFPSCSFLITELPPTPGADGLLLHILPMTWQDLQACYYICDAACDSNKRDSPIFPGQIRSLMDCRHPAICKFAVQITY